MAMVSTGSKGGRKKKKHNMSAKFGGRGDPSGREIRRKEARGVKRQGKRISTTTRGGEERVTSSFLRKTPREDGNRT